MHPLRSTLAALTVVLVACNGTDARITEGVEGRLAHEPDPERIHVMTRDRIVTLSGFVGSPAEQHRLASAAREVEVSRTRGSSSAISTQGSWMHMHRPSTLSSSGLLS